jgi:hypothetical protein
LFVFLVEAAGAELPYNVDGSQFIDIEQLHVAIARDCSGEIPPQLCNSNAVTPIITVFF